ncbi:MAG: hypothetical protein M1825_006421 [Sarcosagium campestre]|nr:MAG: hypothetical protein M1825_006421 [Sarcosagium campestre]
MKPMLKGLQGDTPISQIDMVHLIVKGAENFRYQVGPIDEVHLWVERYSSCPMIKHYQTKAEKANAEEEKNPKETKAAQKKAAEDKKAKEEKVRKKKASAEKVADEEKKGVKEKEHVSASD